MKTLLALAFAGLLGVSGQAAATPVLACYVDTDLLDQYTSPNCNDGLSDAIGTTTAVFKVLNLAAGTPYTIDWSNPACTEDSDQCDRPITSTTTGGQSISITATITNLTTSAVTVSTATARNLPDPEP